MNEERRFFAFHDWGISVYEPSTCRLYHQIQSSDIIPGTQVGNVSKINWLKRTTWHVVDSKHRVWHQIFVQSSGEKIKCGNGRVLLPKLEACFLRKLQDKNIAFTNQNIK